MCVCMFAYMQVFILPDEEVLLFCFLCLHLVGNGLHKDMYVHQKTNMRCDGWLSIFLGQLADRLIRHDGEYFKDDKDNDKD